jgi:hypothetical protein
MVAAGHLQHLWAEVEADHSTARPRDSRELGGELSRTTGNVQSRTARREAGGACRAPPPAAVRPAGEHCVDQVVAVRDAVEHRANGLGIPLSDVD